MEKLISIIIPVYNVEKYLKQCLDSVIKQSYKNLQIILVDDGSTDHSPAICDEYAEMDQRIQVIHQNNHGLPAARNRGLEYVKGEYIGFVDSDDWIHVDMYRHLVEILESNDADISTVECIKTSGEIQDRESKVKVQALTRDQFARVFFKIGSRKIVYYVVNRLYKKKVINLNHFVEEFSVGEDVLASYKALIKAEKIAVSNQEMYYYMMNSGMTSSFHPKYFQLVDIWNRIRVISEQVSDEHQEYAKVNQARIYFTLLSELAISGEYKNLLYKDKISEFEYCLKKNRKYLLQSDISLERKILIFLFCLNYRICAFVISKLKYLRNGI